MRVESETPSQPQLPAPIESKVVYSSWTTMATGTLVWALVTFLPLFHNGLPPQLQGFLPYIVATVLGTAAGYYAKHTPRLDEVFKTAFQILGDPQLLAGLEQRPTSLLPPMSMPPGVFLPGPVPAGKPPEDAPKEEPQV